MTIPAEAFLNSGFILLGSNLGDRLRFLGKAIRMLNGMECPVETRSSVYETEPWGFVSGKNFLNMVVKISTNQSPEGMLSIIKIIEANLGRSRTSEQYQPRTIDLDILFYNELIIEKPGLIIPHPLIPVRRFVLVPMNEIAPGFIHPVLNKPVSILLKECRDHSVVKRKGRPL